MGKSTHFITAAIALLGLAACSLEEDNFRPEPGEPELITISGEISQVYQTRANDSGFADKDEIGVYIVDYNGSNAGTLKNNGNRADNVKFTFDEAAYKWTPARDIYWKDKETHIDVFGYYPYSSYIDKVSEYPFEVRKDQSTEASNGKPGGYEASDFLWGKAENAAPTDRIVMLSFTHRMAGVRVSLVKGSGFTDEEWGAARKEVLILNTKRSAKINLATGTAIATGKIDEAGIIPYAKGGDFRAVVIPQEIAAGTPMISITINGTSYKYSRDEATNLAASRQHNFTITVNKRAIGDFEFIVSDESITTWENDPVSHDATTKEYIVVNVATPGTLDECIKAAGIDINKVKNLKVTGVINARDFAVLRYKATVLESLNISETRINGTEKGIIDGNNYSGGSDDEIPYRALGAKKTLMHIILPQNIIAIGGSAFSGCDRLVGSLTIPEGVTTISDFAFCFCNFGGFPFLT